MFPITRSRRLRATPAIRRLVRENALSSDDLIYPVFVCEGANVREPIGSMPGINRFSVDTVSGECNEIEKLGIPAVLLFGIPSHKDATGSEAYNANGVVQRAIRAIKKNSKNLLIITDVCMCEYTDHGHCGVIKGDSVDNDATLELLCKEALSHAEAGADIIAPSDMMDGRVSAIRKKLDENGFELTPIMSYAVKYASAYYGPFREAAESTPAFGDRKTYQMDPANRREAIKETLQDIAEGADMVMVKPALAYLDIIRDVRDITDLPLAAYNVSGEYSMIMAAAEKGWIDGDKVIMESLLSMKRAGADMIITYFAKTAARLLNN
ncbi:MAG: porphobilinogen synthase [Deferribacteraceae bacterium]|jgi:porphobilinogen synthase|nr:porphobilinogen synthase [Deferribacteraceae bacterium]